MSINTIRPSLVRTVLLAGTALAASPALAQQSVQTTNPFVGITHEHIVTTIGGRIQSINAVIIDMSAPGLSFQLSPQNGAAAQMTNEQTTRSYLNQVGAQVAINTHFFTLDGLPTADLIGLGASNGDAYSPWASTAGALSAGFNISNTNVATLVTPGATGGFTTSPSVPLYNAIGVSMTNGANPRIVTGGSNSTNNSSFDTTPNPRTAMATLPGNRVVMLTVDGRQTGVAEGLTLPEMASFLISRYSAIDAVNLDGGGSTTLVMNQAGTRVMNAPVGVGSGQAAINTERANGANLAIFATRQYGLAAGRELIASESFDYASRAVGVDSNLRPTSGGVNSLNGGTGWASTWSDTGTRWAGVVNAADASFDSNNRTSALNYTSPAGEALPASGGQYRGAFGTSSVSSRQLDLSLVSPSILRNGQLGADGSTLWLSFLAQSATGAGTTGTTTLTQRFAYLQLGNGVRFGKLENSPTGNWGLQDAATGGATSFSTVSSGNETMFLARIEFLSGREQVSLWLNPASLTDATLLGAPTLSMSVADFTFADLTINNRFSTDFDEIRLGTTFGSVVPTPGIAGAMSLLGLTAMRRRR